MQITLAMPYEGHKPDETIDVADAVARELLRTGWGRTPDEKPKKAAAKKAEPTEKADADDAEDTPAD